MSGPLPAPSALPLTLYIASCSCGVFRPLEPHRQRGHLRGQPQGSAGVPQAQEGVPALGGVKPVWSGSAEPGAREAHGIFCLVINLSLRQTGSRGTEQEASAQG